MNKIKVLIADDHQLVREGIRAIIQGAPDMDVVGLAASGEEAINNIRKCKPDVVLMDIVMPGMSGIEAARWIKELNSAIKIIMVTMEISKVFVSASIKVGVEGFLPKDSSKKVLKDAIRSVYNGERYFNNVVRTLIFEDFFLTENLKKPEKTLSSELTKRETEVLAMVASGKSNKLLAEALAISVKTVETHKTHILLKLGLNNNAELIRYALKKSIVSI